MRTFAVDRQTLCRLIPRLQGQKVLILGDAMLDVYLEGDAHRISPEAPVPVVSISGERRMLGGAANVAHNIRALGGKPHLVALRGPGTKGDVLEGLLREADVGSSLIVTPGRKTSVKTRVMARGQQMLRLDREDSSLLDETETRRVLDTLREVLPDHRLLVMSDYAKGLLTPSLCGAVLAEAAARGVRVLADPKPANADCYRGVDLMTPNRREAVQLARLEARDRESILDVGRRVMERYGCAQLLITLGGEGMALFMRDGGVWNIPTAAKAVFDVAGAGDTVIATAALALAAGAALPAACSLANYAAGGVVEHVGVITVSGEELLRMVRQGAEPEFIRWDEERT